MVGLLSKGTEKGILYLRVNGFHKSKSSAGELCFYSKAGGGEMYGNYST